MERIEKTKAISRGSNLLNSISFSELRDFHHSLTFVVIARFNVVIYRPAQRSLAGLTEESEFGLLLFLRRRLPGGAGPQICLAVR
jgi:hypothetical protein